jgi:hypothetical protein
VKLEIDFPDAGLKGVSPSDLAAAVQSDIDGGFDFWAGSRFYPRGVCIRGISGPSNFSVPEPVGPRTEKLPSLRLIA